MIRSLAKAMSFSLAGSILANMGMLRRISTSCSMDIGLFSPFRQTYSAAIKPLNAEPGLLRSS